MRWNGWTHALAAMLTAGTILLIGGVVFLGAFASGSAPLFDWQMIVRGRNILEVSNGPQCLPQLPMLACVASRITRTEFRITYTTRDGPIVLVAIVPPRQGTGMLEWPWHLRP